MVPEPGVGKLGPNWEGPYRVKKALGGGAYELGTLEGKQVPRAWNVVNLRRYYLYATKASTPKSFHVKMN